MELTKEELRERVLEGDLEMQLHLAASPWTPLNYLQQVSSLYNMSQEMKKQLGDRRSRRAWPEHRELDEAVGTAIEAASVALDAGLNAAWQLLWLMHECDCRACKVRRQRENAEAQ